MKPTNAKDTLTPSQHIDKAIQDLPDWRGKLMTRLRKLIHVVAPEITEDWKWDTPIFACKGNVVAIGAFKEHIKFNFFKGASLPDPNGLFNAGLEAKTSRGIDIHEGDKIDEEALKDLIIAAVALNTSGSKKK